MVVGAACLVNIGRTHPDILRLQGLDTLGDVSIIDVIAVDIHKMLEGSRFVARSLVGGGQFEMERHACFCIDSRDVQGLVIPANGGFGYTLFEEALGQPGSGLHDLRERMSAIH
jgi:hypothetical protein